MPPTTAQQSLESSPRHHRPLDRDSAQRYSRPRLQAAWDRMAAMPAWARCACPGGRYAQPRTASGAPRVSAAGERGAARPGGRRVAHGDARRKVSFFARRAAGHGVSHGRMRDAAGSQRGLRLRLVVPLVLLAPHRTAPLAASAADPPCAPGGESSGKRWCGCAPDGTKFTAVQFASFTAVQFASIGTPAVTSLSASAWW